MKKVIVLLLALFMIVVGVAAFTSYRTTLENYFFGLFPYQNSQAGTEQAKPVPNQQTGDATQPTPESPSKVAPITPKDSFAIRGVIEGFYGPPWTMAQRISMLGFMGKNYFNTYVYAPKDDPYLRANWKDLYPASQLQQVKSLVQTAKVNGITFVYSISPGIPSPLQGESVTPAMAANSITFTSANDVQRLESKIDQLRSIGVHTFMLSFDDVQHYLKSADQGTYGSDYPRAHIDLANKVLKDEQAKDPYFRLWVAPTDYFGLKDSTYWSTIRLHLDPSVQVIWTGSWVLNESITSSQAEQVTRLLGRKPLIWDNYPVNDYSYVIKKAPQLLMGPLTNRSPDLSAHASGLLANPMLQPEASKIALCTIAQYLYSPSTYNPQSAWDVAIKAMPGVGDVSAFRKFCQYSSQSTLSTTNSTGFTNLVSSFWQDYPSGQTQSEIKLRNELQLLSALPNDLQQNISNHELLKEIDPWAVKLGEEGRVGLQALAYLDLAKDHPQRFTAKEQLQTSLYQIKSSNLKVGAEILAFIQKAALK